MPDDTDASFDQEAARNRVEACCCIVIFLAVVAAMAIPFVFARMLK